MPSIKRQDPSRSVASTFPPGSALATAVPVSSLREDRVKVCIYGRNRCLSGDTFISYAIRDQDERMQNRKGGTLAHLYRRFNGITTPGKGYYQREQTVCSQFLVQSVMDDGDIFDNLIEDVMVSGVKTVYRVLTEHGSVVKASKDHLFMVPDGSYAPLELLTPGCQVLRHPGTKKKQRASKGRVYRPTVCVKYHSTAGIKVINGYTYHRLSVYRAAYEAFKNGLEYAEYIRILNKYSQEDIDKLWVIPEWCEVHHLDNNPCNNVSSNLVLTESSASHQKNYHEVDFVKRTRLKVEPEMIVGIEEVGEEITYDVQVCGPYHNFVADKVVVHNSGKTTLAAQFRKPLLIISSEPDTNGGATSVADVDGVTLSRVSTKKLPGDRVHGSAKVVAIANELAAQNPFATVVLDTVTSLQDLILVELMGLPKVPEMMSWGMVPDGVYQQRAEKLRETIRPLLDLSNCNVVVLAQEKDHNATEDRGGRSKLMHTMQQGSFMAPALGATNAQWLQDACGYVVQIYEDELTQEVAIPQTDADGQPLPPAIQRVGTGRRQRHLRLLYHPNFAAGGRWQFDRHVPEFVTAPTPRELYAEMARFVPALKV